MAKLPWLKLGKKTAPELPLEPPIWMGNHSNREDHHQHARRQAQMREEILRRADREARRHGMDRRQFLASSMGMAVTLTVINEMGCGSTAHGSPSGPGGGDASMGGGPPLPEGGFPGPDGGPYVVTPEATCD